MNEFRYVTKDVIQVKLTQGHTTLIDADKIDLLKQTFYLNEPYVFYKTPDKKPKDGKPRVTHLSHLIIGTDLMTDHINGCTLDYRVSNLRTTTHRDNSCNRKMSIMNKTGCNGVFKAKSPNTGYVVKICNYQKVKKYYFGLRKWKTEEKAFEAAKKFRGKMDIKNGNTNGQRRDNPTVNEIVATLI